MSAQQGFVERRVDVGMGITDMILLVKGTVLIDDVEGTCSSQSGHGCWAGFYGNDTEVRLSNLLALVFCASLVLQWR